MWRSNVLRLRNCSSAPIRKHGVNINTRWYSSEQSLPITEKEFERALEKVFKLKWDTESKVPQGFAISGGVDSMALAALYAQARSVNRFLPNPHGFIVDHKVRPESTEEAEWVAEQLRVKFGMDSTVLSLTWPDDIDPLDLNKFETEARTLRYQALGQACRDRKITSLMVAHHGDDQAETVLMRLSNNRLRSGLRAMQSVEWIPECAGMYGVYHSGKALMPRQTLNIPFPVEQGGVQIMRPLLSFEKSRLIATCEKQGIAWAEDKTNQNQTITSRNAIRHIYKNHKVPEALSIKSLVDVSLHMQKRIESHKAFAQELFDQCLMKLDIQTGSLCIRFPPFSALLDRPIETESDKNEARDNAYCLLERVGELVSPRPKAPLRQLPTAIERIYPDFADPEEGKSKIWADKLKSSFSVFSVWWRFWDSPSPFSENTEENVDPTRPHPREWLLTRQPLEISERRNPANRIVYPSSRTVSLSSRSTRPRETYQLLDGRFWIHLRNLTNDTLVLRIFEKDDDRHFPSAHQERVNADEEADYFATRRPHRFIAAALDLLKPSDLRYTLPAVFRKDSETGAETLIGFPTLEVRMNGFGAPEGICEWSVHYKKIDLGCRSPGEVIVPGTSRADITTKENRQRMQSKGLAKMKARKKLANADEPKRNDPFTGFKRGSKRKEKNPRDRMYVMKHLSLMQSQDADGLGFLDVESPTVTAATPQGGAAVKSDSQTQTAPEQNMAEVKTEEVDAMSIVEEESLRQTHTRPQKRRQHR